MLILDKRSLLVTIFVKTMGHLSLWENLVKLNQRNRFIVLGTNIIH